MFQTPDTASKKASPKKGAAPQPTAARTAKTAPSSAPVAGAITPEKRNWMIAEAAYFIAERRGFANGSPLEDWLAAESEIDAMLSKRKA